MDPLPSAAAAVVPQDACRECVLETRGGVCVCFHCVIAFCSLVEVGEGVEAAVLLRGHGAGGPGEELDCLTHTKMVQSLQALDSVDHPWTCLVNKVCENR